jgi:hypothetical protein
MAIWDIERFRAQEIGRGIGVSPVVQRRIQQMNIEQTRDLRGELATASAIRRAQSERELEALRTQMARQVRRAPGPRPTGPFVIGRTPGRYGGPSTVFVAEPTGRGTFTTRGMLETERTRELIRGLPEVSGHGIFGAPETRITGGTVSRELTPLAFMQQFARRPTADWLQAITERVGPGGAVVPPTRATKMIMGVPPRPEAPEELREYAQIEMLAVSDPGQLSRNEKARYVTTEMQRARTAAYAEADVGKRGDAFTRYETLKEAAVRGTAFQEITAQKRRAGGAR